MGRRLAFGGADLNLSSSLHLALLVLSPSFGANFSPHSLFEALCDSDEFRRLDRLLVFWADLGTGHSVLVHLGGLAEISARAVLKLLRKF